MRTHVYTQGGKPMLAALGHGVDWLFRLSGRLGGAVFRPARAGDPAVKAGRAVAGGDAPRRGGAGAAG